MESNRDNIFHIIEYTQEELQEIFKSNFSDRYSNVIDGTPVYKIENNCLLPGETFRAYPKNEDICYADFREYLQGKNKIQDQIEVSNLGRIKINNSIKTQYHIDYGYLKVKIINNYYYCVYRMVAETWCKCPVNRTSSNWSVHHINNNGFDNRPENLIWLNKKEHSYIEKYNKKKLSTNFEEVKNYLINNFDKTLPIQIIKDYIEDYYLLSKNNMDKLIEKYCKKYNLTKNDFPNLLIEY